MIDPRDHIIAELTRLVEVQSKRIEELEKQVAELTERLSRSSRNSSKPPSSDPPWTGKPPKRKGKRKRGGQSGHPKHSRPKVPAEDVSEFHEVKPETCQLCGCGLSGTDPEPLVHQVTELPEPKPVVTEYHLHRLRCEHCGASTRASLPKGVPQSAFGPRLIAALGLLTSRFKVSKRGAKAFFAEVFGIQMALGSVSKQERRLSQAIAPPVAAAAAWVQRQGVANVDETGWREAGRKAWLWTAVTPQVTVYQVSARRSRASLTQLIGADWSGILGSDRFSAYSHLPERQLCWAHMSRDFLAMSERPAESHQVGRKLLALTRWIFRDWYRFRQGQLQRNTLMRRLAPRAVRFEELLAEGVACEQPRTAATCAELSAVAKHAFTFAWADGVEPTNNSAERSLRLAVQWRKQSLGTQSEHGSRFVERTLTCSTSLEQQQRSIYKFFEDALMALAFSTAPPSLLPDGV